MNIAFQPWLMHAGQFTVKIEHPQINLFDLRGKGGIGAWFQTCVLIAWRQTNVARVSIGLVVFGFGIALFYKALANPFLRINPPKQNSEEDRNAGYHP